jgi:hypothetical protein
LWLVKPWNISTIPTKGLKNITFNDNFPWNFTHKKIKLKNNLPIKFSILLKVVEFISNDLNMFISTIRYDNVDGYAFFRLNFFLPLKIYLGQVFKKLDKNKMKFLIFKKWKTVINKGFQKTFLKWLVYIYKNAQWWSNFIFIILVISFNFEAQIICMWNLE